MKAFTIFFRATFVTTLILAVFCAGSLRGANAARDSSSLAGRWVAHLVWRCQPGGGHGDPICLMAAHAPGPVTWAGTFDITSDAAGHGSYTYEATVVGAGSGISRQCGARLFASDAVTGVCPLTGYGKGYFDPSQATFFSTDEWVTFYGSTLVRAVHDAASAGGWTAGDLPIPAQPGFYDDDTISSVSDAMNMALGRIEPLNGIEYIAVVARY